MEDVCIEHVPLGIVGHVGRVLFLDGGAGTHVAIRIGLALLDGHFLHLFHFLGVVVSHGSNRGFNSISNKIDTLYVNKKTSDVRVKKK